MQDIREDIRSFIKSGATIDNKNGIFTSKAFNKGDLLFTLHGKLFTEPTRETIRIGEKKHIDDPLGQFMNHHCDPTTYINGRDVYARVDNNNHNEIEITFDYNQNERKMSAPFTCICNAVYCKRMVTGSR